MNAWYEWREAPPAAFGVVGDPIAHSLSPRMQSAALASLGLSFEYLAIRVPDREFDVAMDHLRTAGYRGLNVTVPLKEAALRWATLPDDAALRIGAANTLDLAGGRATNTDAPAVLDVFGNLGIKDGSSVMVLGAGGTARAVVAALEAAGYPLAIWNRSPERAQRLIESLNSIATLLAEPDLEPFDVIVNTTSAELSTQELPLDWSRARTGAAALDMFYREDETDFVRIARQRGLKAVDGKAMLVAQGARSLEWWLGVEAPRSAMLNAIS